MNLLKYLIIVWLISSSIFMIEHAYADGGKFGGGGAGGSWGNPVSCKFSSARSRIYTSATDAGNANCSHYRNGSLIGWHYTSPDVLIARGDKSGGGYPECSGGGGGYITFTCDDPNQCPEGQYLKNGTCVPDDGVSDDEPTPDKDKDNKDDNKDCDPAIQKCDENGKPLCDCCEKLDTLIGINQKIQSNTAQTNNLLSQTNNHLTSIKSNTAQTNTLLNQTNAKLDTLINILNNKGINVDLSRIHQQLDTLIAKKVDLAPINNKLDELIQAVKDNKYDDTQLLKRLDDALSLQVQNNEKLDEQTGLLVQIRDLLKPTPQTLQANFTSPDFNPSLDPWSAIRGFDIHQNLIQAQAQCPSAENYSFDFFGQHYVMPIDIMCSFFAKLGPAVLFLAYMTGAFIVVKGD